MLRTSTMLAQDYLAGMHLAGRYAYAGREWVARTIVKKVLWAKIEEEVHNHHNFAWQEEHDGEMQWVVRKGATPAFPGQKGFVGGSMGDNAVIIEGVESPESKEALYSTVHGAGRVMSRTAAKGKQRWAKARWGCRNYRNCVFSAPIAYAVRAWERRRAADVSEVRIEAAEGTWHHRTRKRWARRLCCGESQARAARHRPARCRSR